MYGLISQSHLEDIVEEVCNSLGYGTNGSADKLLLETAGAETQHGKTADKTIYAGMGITQIDKIPFQDIKDRARDSDKNKIMHDFGIDIDLVKWEEIRYNPFLAMIFTRLKYKKIPTPIPTSIELRAYYWKKYYNTEAGKGTFEHYMEANK